MPTSFNDHNTAHQKHYTLNEQGEYRFDLQETTLCFAKDNTKLVGKGRYGYIYHAYAINPDDGSINHDQNWVAKVQLIRNQPELERLVEVNKITQQFYKSTPPLWLGFNDSNDAHEYVTLLENLGRYTLEDNPITSVSQSIEVTLQILMQLSLIHERTSSNNVSVFHNDLKNRNIVLDNLDEQGWLPNIIDFDLAFKNKHHQYLHDFNGNSAYMAPETTSDLYGLSYVSTQSDIYSLVSCILAIFNVEFPFKKPTDTQLPTHKIDLKNETPNTDDFDFRSRLIQFLDRMQSYYSKERPQLEECIQFFQLALQYNKINDILDKIQYDSDSLEDEDKAWLRQQEQQDCLLQRKQRTKAQMILLSLGAWQTQFPYPNSTNMSDNITFKHFPFEQKPKFCQAIIDNQQNLSAARILAYFSIISVYHSEDTQKAWNTILDDSKSNSQFEAIISLSKLDQLTAQNIDNILNHYKLRQCQALTALSHSNLPQLQLEKLLHNIHHDYYSHLQIETLNHLGRGGYHVDNLVGHILPIKTDSEHAYNDQQLNFINKVASNKLIYDLDNTLKLLSTRDSTIQKSQMDDTLSFLADFSQIDNDDLHLLFNVIDCLQNNKLLNQYLKSECNALANTIFDRIQSMLNDCKEQLHTRKATWCSFLWDCNINKKLVIVDKLNDYIEQQKHTRDIDSNTQESQSNNNLQAPLLNNSEESLIEDLDCLEDDDYTITLMAQAFKNWLDYDPNELIKRRSSTLDNTTRP